MKTNWINKTALITGASSGIGAAIAQNLASQGIRVILIARREDMLAKLAAKIRLKGGVVSYYISDLSKSENVDEVITNIIQNEGIPDILINNVGVGWYGFFAQMPWNTIQELLALNIGGMVQMTSQLLPKMLSLPRARIINIGSVAGKLPEQGIALYSASKAFMDAFTKCVHRELRGTNATISVLRAGPVKTEFYDRAANAPNGSRVPAEKLAVSAERVAQSAWRLINHPHRYAYVPVYLFLSPLLEILFSWLLDLLGPVLLNLRKNKAING